MRSEADLIYSDWVRRNREYVTEKTGGRMGYIHVPDMWQSGLIEFNTWFYPQLDKEGMVVDTRWNGGGAVSQMLVERLRRATERAVKDGRMDFEGAAELRRLYEQGIESSTYPLDGHSA